MAIFGRGNYVIADTEQKKYAQPTGPTLLAETVNGHLTGEVCYAGHVRSETGGWTGGTGCTGRANCHSGNWWKMRESVYREMMGER